jgi:type II secretory pathway pseudopilin PulG
MPLWNHASPRTPAIASAFTVVEMLVALAILAIVVTLTVPTLSEVRQKSYQAVDATGLKQIGNAIHSYAGDNNGAVPHRTPMPENDLAMGPVPANAGQIAGLSAMSSRLPGSPLSKTEDKIILVDSINVPTGLGQLVTRMNIANRQSATTYVMNEAYLQAQDLFSKSDRQAVMPNQTPARNHWWQFASVALKSPLSSWSLNPNFNNLSWPSGPADGDYGSNYYFRTSWAWRGADYASVGPRDTLAANNSPANLKMSESTRQGKVMVMSRDPWTMNTYGRDYSTGCHMLINDGSVQFSTSHAWRQGNFNSGAGWVTLPSGSPPTPNPYTSEYGVQAYKLSHAFAYADKYLLQH